MKRQLFHLPHLALQRRSENRNGHTDVTKQDRPIHFIIGSVWKVFFLSKKDLVLARSKRALVERLFRVRVDTAHACLRPYTRIYTYVHPHKQNSPPSYLSSSSSLLLCLFLFYVLDCLLAFEKFFIYIKIKNM